jgi:hypothetical protein
LRWFVIAVEVDGMSDQSVSIPISSLVSYEKWLEEIGKTPATGWRWRKRGWLDVVNIAGRLYLDRSEIARFEAAAAAGKFAKVHPTPSQKEDACERAKRN